MTITDIIFQALEDYKNKNDVNGYFCGDTKIKKIEMAGGIIGLLFEEEGGELFRTIIKIGGIEEVDIPVFSDKRNNDADDENEYDADDENEYDDDDENEYDDDDENDGWQTTTKFEEVEAKEKRRKDYEVSWSTVPEEYVFWAVDYIGEAYFYKEKPELSKNWNYWYTEYDNDQLIDKSFSHGINDNWKDSLRERPNIEEKKRRKEVI